MSSQEHSDRTAIHTDGGSVSEDSPLLSRSDPWKKVNPEKSRLGDSYWYFRRGDHRRPPHRADNAEGMITRQDQILDSPGESCQRGESPAASNPLNTVTIEYYDSQRKSWEHERIRLEQGLMMYRFKYEEVCSRMKLLPAPPELIREDIRERDILLEKARNLILNERQYRKQRELDFLELKRRLEEEERSNDMLRRDCEEAHAEAAKPWWKKLLSRK